MLQLCPWESYMVKEYAPMQFCLAWARKCEIWSRAHRVLALKDVTLEIQIFFKEDENSLKCFSYAPGNHIWSRNMHQCSSAWLGLALCNLTHEPNQIYVHVFGYVVLCHSFQPLPEMNYRNFYEKYMFWLEKVKSNLNISKKGCHVLSNEASRQISSPRIYQEKNHGEV